jgi:hypothetical protein
MRVFWVTSRSLPGLAQVSLRSRIGVNNVSWVRTIRNLCVFVRGASQGKPKPSSSVEHSPDLMLINSCFLQIIKLKNPTRRAPDWFAEHSANRTLPTDTTSGRATVNSRCLQPQLKYVSSQPETGQPEPLVYSGSRQNAALQDCRCSR